MNVVIADIEDAPLEATAAELVAVGIRTDVTDADEVAGLAAATIDRFGAVHVVCNNAGVGGGGRIRDLTLNDWKWVIDVNLWDEATGTYAPVLADRGRSNFGGVALDFPAADVLAPGESSRLFFIRTAATRHELAGLTQFRSTPGTTTDNGFALTFSPVLEGPLVPPPQPGEPVVVPLPPAAPVAGVMMLLGMAVAQRARRR